ncbi:MAG: hypothetical protein LUO89_06365 [Methanothrix sp.]|nr:hypothetical protein [Methanothrix sp.]
MTAMDFFSESEPPSGLGWAENKLAQPKEGEVNIAPEGTWRCVWSECNEAWTGKVDETPEGWRWPDTFTANRLIKAGKIDSAKASFSLACLCPKHQSLVTGGDLRAQASPRLLFTGIH